MMNIKRSLNFFIIVLVCLCSIIQCNASDDVSKYIRNEINTEIKWHKKPIEIEDTKSSYFTSSNIKTIVVLPVKMIPKKKKNLFIDDCENKLLRYLFNDGGYRFKLYKKKHDSCNIGTELVPFPLPKILIIDANKKIKSKIESRFKPGTTECPNNYIFPYFFVSGEKFENNLVGYKDKIYIGIVYNYTNIESRLKPSLHHDIKLRTISGKEIFGKGWDLNNDNILDIFHNKEIFEYGDVVYNRYYLNIDGKWKCEWVDLYEECY